MNYTKAAESRKMLGVKTAYRNGGNTRIGSADTKTFIKEIIQAHCGRNYGIARKLIEFSKILFQSNQTPFLYVAG
jgi:hypothetical protein